jgi:acetylornithine deacetylase/succinyl-diaminopimelate desuccinylase-like protein
VSPAAGDGFADIEAYLDRTAGERLEDYKAFLRIPSVGALSQHDGDMRKTADFLVQRLKDAGLDNVAARETGGHPIVYADWLHAEGAPTILAYGHYDVQPVDPLELWVKPPFEPRVEDGRIYARGASDDKSCVHQLLWAAAASLKTRGRLPLNIRFLFEGEEESGEQNLARWLTDNRDELGADLAVISDSGFFDGNLPAITIGLRGIMYAQIDVVGSRLDLHSGSFGGAVRNPANALATIIAGLHDERGRVTIPGFYDEVTELSPEERAELARLPFDEAAYLDRIGVPETFGEEGYSTLERRGARPTLDVNGIWGGFQGEGSKTIIPAHAHAKVSCRLVPRQDPDRIFESFERHVQALAPSGVTVEVSYLSGGRPSLTPIGHPGNQAGARAIEAVFGQKPLYIREGGSVPVAEMFETKLGLPVVLLGFQPPDDQAHAPNESMRLDNYESGIRTFIRFWDELSRADLGAPAASEVAGAAS